MHGNGDNASIIFIQAGSMRKIGKYQILGLLGKGGMGRVYKAKTPVVDQIVAIKRLSPHPHLVRLLGSSGVRELFIREAKTLATIRHPNVASIFDFDFDDENRPFFVMSYHCMNLGLLIGETYRIEAPTRIVPPDRAVFYIDQILAGLDRLHHAGILHRDIKPYNILITDEDKVVIIDFGLSMLRGELRRTPDNLMVGTPYYAAPEQEVDPDAIDERADLFSAGVLLFRMLTGKLPPENEKQVAPEKINPVLGKFFDDCVCRATAPVLQDRFSTCDEMRTSVKAAYDSWQEDLEKVCQIEIGPAEDPHPESVRRQRRRKQPVKVDRNTAVKFFDLDRVWHPKCAIASAFHVIDDHCVEDVYHGLIWERSGSRYPMDWHEAKAYVGYLNETRFAGSTHWRIPTIDELLCLVRPRSVLGDFCAVPVFDTRQHRLWSGDRKTYTAAWFVEVTLGFVSALDMICGCHVRAVADRTVKPHQNYG